MIIAVIALALLGQTPASGWTWTLYEDAPVVLAEEVPDTANLRTTLECDPGSSVARLTLYGDEAAIGMARISAGDANAMAEARAGRGGSVKLTLRTDHPAFAAFAAGGGLTVAIGEQRRAVEVAPAHLGKLRRFSELCAG